MKKQSKYRIYSLLVKRETHRLQNHAAEYQQIVQKHQTSEQALQTCRQAIEECHQRMRESRESGDLIDLGSYALLVQNLSVRRQEKESLVETHREIEDQMKKLQEVLARLNGKIKVYERRQDEVMAQLEKERLVSDYKDADEKGVLNQYWRRNDR